MVDRVGGKQPQTPVPAKPHHTIQVSPGFFAPALVTVVALPLGFLFALGLQGATLPYIVGITAFGLLTALDLKTGLLRSALGSGFTFLTLSYFFQNSNLAPGIAPTTGLGSLVVAVPPAIGVFLSTVLLSHHQRFRILKQNILGTSAMVAGLFVGASYSPGSSLIGSNPVSTLLFLGLGLGANCIQMSLLFLMDRFWHAKKNAMAVLPTAFFAYNAVIGYEYFTAPTATLAYVFFSSLGFLPLLFVAAV